MIAKGWHASLLSVVLLSALAAHENPTERQLRIERMTPDEKQQLLTKFERFQQLEPTERQRLHQLHAQLEADPQGDELRQIMDHYHEWMTTLGAAQRAELGQLELTQRIKRIKELTKEQKDPKHYWPRMPKVLSPDDRAVVRQWVERQVQANLPPENRATYEALGDEERRKATMRSIMQRLQLFDPSRRTAPPTAELQTLREQLSESARGELMRAESALQRTALMTSWIVQSLGLSPSDRQMMQFVERDLPTAERQRINALSGDDMHREVWWMYMRSFLREGGGRPDNSPFDRPRFDGQRPEGMRPEGTPGRPNGGNPAFRGESPKGQPPKGPTKVPRKEPPPPGQTPPGRAANDQPPPK